MKIKNAIAHLKLLEAQGETDVIITYWDRLLWEHFEEKKFSKETFEQMAEDHHKKFDNSAYQEDVAYFCDWMQEKRKK